MNNKPKSLKKIINQVDRYVLQTYKRHPEAFVRGKGSWLTSISGEKYLDFFPGWGVSNLGHCHPHIVKAISNQAKEIIHLSNIFYMPDQGEVAAWINKKAFPGKVFFSNSGTEAVECAIKAAKAWGQAKGKTGFISFIKSFHGRTLGSVTLTGQNHYRDPFLPLMPDVEYAEFNEIESVKRLINSKTAAVVIELVQGEGGVRVADKRFVEALASLARKNDILLIFDEVQTGFGRTGKFFAHQHFGVKPDILCMGKAIAGGVPMGATLISKNLENILTPGMHASTFGGNYLACAASKAVFEVFEQEKVLIKMRTVEKKLHEFFVSISKQYSQVLGYRHLGMMFGLEMEGNIASDIARICFQKKLILNCTSGNVLRIMPALNLSEKDCEKGIGILQEVFEYVCKK